jgi:GMP synthase-like glutamine amidotransferase
VKILAFRHVPFEHLGRIESVLASHGLGFEYADLHDSSAPLPDPAGYAGLIFMGGPMSVNDRLPYLEREMAWIVDAVGRCQPVLGICLGAQLIAKALGGRVYKNPTREIGWFDIEFTPAAASDPLFGGVDPRETVLQWHGETFDLPTGAVLLAQSLACRHQAFRVEPNVYGLQFHLEATPAMIADWCRQDANCGDLRELTEPLDAYRNAARMESLSQAVFGAWCGLLTSSQGTPPRPERVPGR